MKNYLVLLFTFILFFKVSNLKAEDKKDSSSTLTEVIVKGFQDPSASKTLNTTTISRKKIKEKNYKHLEDSIDSIPNFNWSGGSARPRFFQIRGVGELEQYQGAPNPSVGIFIDDIDYSGFGSFANLFDVERVQVLKGPQSVLWGENALGGVIDIHSKDPNDQEFNGEIESSVGNNGFFSSGAAVGGALFSSDKNDLANSSDTPTFRISSFYNYINGFRKNEFLNRDDTNKKEEATFRGKLKVNLSADSSILFSLLYANFNDGYDAFSIKNGFFTQSDRPGKDALETLGTSMKLRSSLDNDLILENLLSFTNIDTDYSFDGDWGNNIFWGQYAPYDYFSKDKRNRKNLAEEFRLRSNEDDYLRGKNYKWISGVKLQKITEDQNTLQFSNNEVYDSLDSDYSAKSASIFGNLEIPLFEKTSFAIGSRFENRGTDYNDSKNSSFSPNENLYAFSASLDRDLNENSTVFISSNRGYRGGGFNAGPSVPDELKRFKAESYLNFETGVKGELKDLNLKSKLSGFYGRRSSEQVRFAIQDNPNDPLSFTYITDNVANGTTKGIETEVEKTILETLKIYSSIGYLSSKFDNYNDAAGGNLSGRETAHSPKWQFLVGSDYKFSQNLSLNYNLTGKDSFYIDDSNDQKTKRYFISNVNLNYKFESWSLSLWGKNIFNEQYSVRGFYFGNEPPDFPNKKYIQLGDPRQVGLTLSRSF